MAYIEGIDDGRRFMEVARKTTAVKPVAVLRTGMTEFGSRAAASHTGAMAGMPPSGRPRPGRWASSPARAPRRWSTSAVPGLQPAAAWPAGGGRHERWRRRSDGGRRGRPSQTSVARVPAELSPRSMRSCLRSGADTTRSTWWLRPAATSALGCSRWWRSATRWTPSSCSPARACPTAAATSATERHGRVRRPQPLGDAFMDWSPTSWRDRQAHHQRTRPSHAESLLSFGRRLQPDRARHAAGGCAGARPYGMVWCLPARAARRDSRPQDDA